MNDVNFVPEDVKVKSIVSSSILSSSIDQKIAVELLDKLQKNYNQYLYAEYNPDYKSTHKEVFAFVVNVHKSLIIPISYPETHMMAQQITKRILSKIEQGADSVVITDLTCEVTYPTSEHEDMMAFVTIEYRFQMLGRIKPYLRQKEYFALLKDGADITDLQARFRIV